MKKILNSVTNAVPDMIDGMIRAHPQLKVLDETQVIIRGDAPVVDKVGLISGGGSGHEPAHAGYVGYGMLDAACVGDLFSSPSVDQMMKGIRAVDSGKGVLIIAKNYTGDNLNFDMAAELLLDEGIQVEKVVVKDDIAVEDSENTTGRRGVAGTVLIHKIAGAKAQQGADLETVKNTALKAISRIRTFGFAMSPCIIPSVGRPSFILGDNEIELGTGIHGEVGVQKMDMQPSAKLAQMLINRILIDMPIEKGQEVAVLVNGSGATPIMELYILFDDIAKILEQKGIRIFKAFVGEYMTSLEMSGASLSIMKVDNELKELLTAKADALAFKEF